MLKTKNTTSEAPDYWSFYKAINMSRFSHSKEFVDRKTGKRYIYEFIGFDILKKSLFFQIFSAILWLSPVILMLEIALSYMSVFPLALFLVIPFVVAYHFAAMYYIIRGPHVHVEEIKKKGFFSL